MTVSAQPRQGALTGPRSFTVFERYPVLGLTSQERDRTKPYGGEFRGVEGARKFFINTYPDRAKAPLARLADSGVLTYLATLSTHRLNLNEEVEPLTFTSAACLRALGRPAGGHQYQLLAAQIARLTNTVMSTDIRGQHDCFPIIRRAERNQDRWQIYMSPFLIQEARDRKILQINPLALKLRGLERRLYGWGRTYCGGSTRTYAVPLKHAFALSGSTDKPRRFRHALRAIVASNRVPDVNLSLSGDEADAVLTLVRHGSGRPLPLRAEAPAYEEVTFADLCAPITPALAEKLWRWEHPRSPLPVNIEELPLPTDP